MEWTETIVDTSHEAVDILGDFLLGVGFEGYAVEDEEDFKGFLANNEKYWDYVDEELDKYMKGLCRIKLYVDENNKQLLDGLKVKIENFAHSVPSVDFGSLKISTNKVYTEDWENGWKKYYKPLPIGEKIIILPEWESNEYNGERLPVILDPGTIFGTGSHATTRLCLEKLEEIVQGGEKVLDLGCGSGILAIAAVRLGAEYAVGVDIDPRAAVISAENASLNGMGKNIYRPICGDVTEKKLNAELAKEKFDIVTANIVADVIKCIAPDVAPLLKENGKFLCSGIIDTRACEVEDYLREKNYRILSRNEDDGWVSFLCQVEK